MGARIAYAGAVVLVVVALVGVGSASRQVLQQRVWLDDHLPAVVYEPHAASDESRLPVLVLSHGELANGSLLSSLARKLARQGIAVVVFDSRGHGRNRLPFERSEGAGSEGMLDDFDAAVLWARAQARYDGQRVAVGGYASGAAGAMAYAARRDPGVAAVVAISGSAPLDGPYPPPNVLLIWAEGDPSRLRETLRQRGAELIAARRVVVERDYGSFERGTAVRLAEIEWTNHLSILYAGDAVSEISSWLARALEPAGKARAAGDARLPWAVLGLLATLVLLWGVPRVLASLVPSVSLPEVAQPWRRLGLVVGALAGSAVLLVAVDPVSGSGPLSAYPLDGARDLLGLFAIAGVGLLAYAARDARVRSDGLGDWRTWAGAGLVVGLGYVTWGILCQPFWDPLLTPRLVLPWLVAAALLLPWFGASEWLLRGAGRSRVWLPGAGRLVTLAALAAGAFAGLLPAVILPALLAIVLAFAVFEALAFRMSRLMPGPWIPALTQSLWTAWLLVAFFPYEG